MSDPRDCVSSLAACRCCLPDSHLGLHRCVCGGAWDGSAVPWEMPRLGWTGTPKTWSEIWVENPGPVVHEAPVALPGLRRSPWVWIVLTSGLLAWGLVGWALLLTGKALGVW